MQKQTFALAPLNETLAGGAEEDGWTRPSSDTTSLIWRHDSSSGRHSTGENLQQLGWKHQLLSFSAALETRRRKCEARWSRTQIFSIRAASLPLDGIGQNSVYKWPLNGCIYQIIAACRFHKMRLIRTSVEKYNEITEWEMGTSRCVVLKVNNPKWLIWDGHTAFVFLT